MAVEQTEPEETETPETEEPEAPPETEAPAEELEAKAEGEQTAEGETTEPETDADGEEKEEKEEVSASGQKPGHRRSGGYNRKIERLEREREILLQQLAANRPAEPAKEQTADEKATEYIRALVDKEIKARDAAAEQQRQAAELQKREQEFRDKHEDYDDALDAFARARVPPSHIQALLTSPEAPAIMYGLAKNPAELARISALPPLEAAREFGRLEAKASVTSAPKTAPKSASRPPAPPTSVGGSKASSRNLDDLPLADYKRALRSKGR